MAQSWGARSVWGLVTYTGEQSKLVLNNKMEPVPKVTAVEKLLNKVHPQHSLRLCCNLLNLYPEEALSVM